MVWTIDYYSIGKKGVYRLIHRGLNMHAQLLRPGEGFWDDVLHYVKFERGKCKAVEDYDASPKGWETVEGGAKP